MALDAGVQATARCGRQGRGLRLQAGWQAGARRRPVARRRGAHLAGTADEDPGQGRADPAAAGPALPPPARRADRGEAVGHPRLAHRADPAVGEADKRRAARPRTPVCPASARRGLHGADRRGRGGLGDLLSDLRRSAPAARLPGNGPRPAHRARHRRGGRPRPGRHGLAAVLASAGRRHGMERHLVLLRVLRQRALDGCVCPGHPLPVPHRGRADRQQEWPA